jgi:hypothetical protein
MMGIEMVSLAILSFGTSSQYCGSFYLVLVFAFE